MRTDRCWLLLALIVPLLATAAVPDQEYAYSFSLQAPDTADAYRLRFTPAIYAASWPQAELSDIVVVDTNGNAVPFASMPAASGAPRIFTLKRHALPLPDAAQDDKKFIRVSANAEHGSAGFIIIPQLDRSALPERPKRWLVDAREQVALSHIDIESGLGEADFELHLVVDSSDDLQHWRTVVADATVLSLTGGDGSVHKRRIKMNRVPARYYRLHVREGNSPWQRAQPPEVALVGKTVVVARAAEPLQTLTVEAEPSDTSARSYEYHLPALLPLQSLQLVLPDSVSAANAQVSVRDPYSEQDRWSALTSLNAIRVHDRISDEVNFTPRRIQRLRVRVDTGLSQPPQLKVSWRPGVYVFLAQGQGPYRLLAGSRTARRGNYPMAAALEQLRRDQAGDWQLPLAAAGPRMQAGGPSPLEMPFDWTRALLWLVLGAGALLVIGLATSLLRNRS